MSEMGDRQPAPPANTIKKHEGNMFNSFKENSLVTGELWTDGLICAFEFARGNRWMNPKFASRTHTMQRMEKQIPRKQPPKPLHASDVSTDNRILGQRIDLDSPRAVSNVEEIHMNNAKEPYDSHWVPIGWARISELVQLTDKDSCWDSQQVKFGEDEDDITVADIVAPYWERPAGPTWWCHLDPTHYSVESWLSNARWLHPAISVALRDESRLISERMKHLLYEVPVRVAGGLLFELLGQSVGDPFREEDDIPIVLRSWQCQNFLITALHIKGSAAIINVLGITEVQELLFAGGNSAPKSIHEVIAHLACRLSRWDDRLFRKYVFGAADEIELKFVNRRSHEDLNLLVIILNQEIKRLATQAIRVKWSLHAREEIVFELLRHLKGNATKVLLEGIKDSTREMLEDQEAVRGRLFTVQDVMQSTVRAWLQDRSLRVSHNLGIFGGCGLVLSILTGLFGINVDGIPGASNTPYAFGMFAGVLCLVGAALVGLGMLYLGLQKPVSEELVNVRKLELQQLVSMFQQEAEQHAKVRQGMSRHTRPPASPRDVLSHADYVLIT